jgi:hypothetical protein
MSSAFPQILREGFDGLIEGLEKRARQAVTGFTAERLGDVTPARYVERFAPAVRAHRVSSVVFVSDHFGEDVLTPRFVEAICERVEEDGAFSFKAFVGFIAQEHANTRLHRLKEVAKQAPGQVEIVEMGMKPLLQGLFTNVGGLCRGLEEGETTIERVYLFDNVDLTAPVLELARAYLRFEEDDR